VGQDVGKSNILLSSGPSISAIASFCSWSNVFSAVTGSKSPQPAGGIFTFRDEKIVRIEWWWDRQTALEAAGLAE
jgi:hypothetical protein